MYQGFPSHWLALHLHTPPIVMNVSPAPTRSSMSIEWASMKMLRVQEVLRRDIQHAVQTVMAPSPSLLSLTVLGFVNYRRPSLCPLRQGRNLRTVLGVWPSADSRFWPLPLTSRTVTVPCPMVGGKPHSTLSVRCLATEPSCEAACF